MGRDDSFVGRHQFIADDLGLPRDYSWANHGTRNAPGAGDEWIGPYVDEGAELLEGLLYAHAEFKRRYPEEGDA